MKTRILTFAWVAWMAGLQLVPGSTNDLSAALQKGLFEEEANHDFPAAIRAYEEVISQFDQERKLGATAIFRLGEIYRKQGKTNEANAQYQRILREFTDQSVLAGLSQGYLGGPGTAEAARGTNQSVEPPLASEAEEIKRIQAMIKESPDLINAKIRGSAGWTPLDQAAYKGELLVAEFLIANGAEIEAKERGQQTPLHLAADEGHKAMVELLLNKKANVQAVDGEGITPLHLAAQKGFRSIVELLVARGADVNAKNTQGATPLHLAVANGFKSTSEFLLAHGADPNLACDYVKTKPGVSGTPLHIAVFRGDLSLAELLITNKANANALSSSGVTPLAIAAERGNTNLAMLLLLAGANPNSTNSPLTLGGQGWTPLHQAVDSERKDSVKLLLEHKAEPNARAGFYRLPSNQDRKGYTPLLMATVKGSVEIAELLLSFKADPNLSSDEGDSPLLNTITMSAHPLPPPRIRILKALLEHHADPENGGRGDRTPLMIAALTLDREVVELLLAFKADPNARDKQGQTALHLLFQGGGTKEAGSMAELLLNNGADPNIIDAQGKTPLFYLSSSNPGAEVLRRHGALSRVPDFSTIRIGRAGAEQTEVIFRRDTNSINQFMLFEALGAYYWKNPLQPVANTVGVRAPRPVGFAFPFPDFSRVKILRPVKGKLVEKNEMRAQFLTASNTFDCSKDIPIQFGDELEVAEREHGLTEKPTGMTVSEADSLRKCLTRKVVFKVRDQSVDLELGVDDNGSYLSRAMGSPRIQEMLRSSSDLSRVKISGRRVNAQPREFTEDVEPFWKGQKPISEDIWLQDGDVIEVLDKL